MPISLSRELKVIAGNDLPFLEINKLKMCLFFKTLIFLILRFSNKNIGLGLPVPYGSRLLKSETKELLAAENDNFDSKMNKFLFFRFFINSASKKDLKSLSLFLFI